MNTVVTCTMTFNFHTSSLENLRGSIVEKTVAEGSLKFAKVPQIVYNEVGAGALVLGSNPADKPLINPVLCRTPHDVLALLMLFWTSNLFLPLTTYGSWLFWATVSSYSNRTMDWNRYRNFWFVDSFSRWENQSSGGQLAANYQELASKMVAWFYVHQLPSSGSLFILPTIYAYCVPRKPSNTNVVMIIT